MSQCPILVTIWYNFGALENQFAGLGGFWEEVQICRSFGTPPGGAQIESPWTVRLNGLFPGSQHEAIFAPDQSPVCWIAGPPMPITNWWIGIGGLVAAMVD